jgi:hypothetical protein
MRTDVHRIQRVHQEEYEAVQGALSQELRMIDTGHGYASVDERLG